MRSYKRVLGKRSLPRCEKNSTYIANSHLNRCRGLVRIKCGLLCCWKSRITIVCSLLTIRIRFGEPAAPAARADASSVCPEVVQQMGEPARRRIDLNVLASLYAWIGRPDGVVKINSAAPDQQFPRVRISFCEQVSAHSGSKCTVAVGMNLYESPPVLRQSQVTEQRGKYLARSLIRRSGWPTRFPAIARFQTPGELRRRRGKAFTRR